MSASARSHASKNWRFSNKGKPSSSAITSSNGSIREQEEQAARIVLECDSRRLAAHSEQSNRLHLWLSHVSHGTDRPVFFLRAFLFEQILQTLQMTTVYYKHQ